MRSVVPLALLILTGGLASANIIPTFSGESGGGGLFTFDYTAALDPQQNLVTGGELCFADVVGLTGTPTAPSGWIAANQVNSVCPILAGVSVPNDLPSVLYTYSGATTVYGPADLGTFTLQSTVGSQGEIAYGAMAQNKSNLTLTANQGEDIGPSPIPEPSSMLLLIPALAVMALAKRQLSGTAGN
jgi:hypothetical protein